VSHVSMNIYYTYVDIQARPPVNIDALFAVRFTRDRNWVFRKTISDRMQAVWRRALLKSIHNGYLTPGRGGQGPY
jgi:hypothetical protein